MKFLVKVQWDTEVGNKLQKAGKVGPMIESILSDLT